MNLTKVITNIIKYGVNNITDRELLGKSLFYYCSGKDPSPIIAFGSRFPLYIYSDIKDSFESEMANLSKRIQSYGNQLLYSGMVQGRLMPYSIGVTQWLAPDNEPFCVAYFPYDAKVVFQSIYADVDTGGHSNFIQPMCICNFRYEFKSESFQREVEFFQKIESRAEYIFGYCFSNKYKAIGEYNYYGDYEIGTTIKLYQRMYWYVY